MIPGARSRTLLTLLGVSTILLPGISRPAHVTTIVVARSANEIVIGADSKVTDTYGNEINSQVCKIQQVGNLFVAFEGLLRDKATDFSVPDIAVRTLRLKPEASVAEKVSILTGFLTSELFAELPRVRSNSAHEFHTKLEGQTFLRVVVAGFERNRPVVFVRQFRTTFIARGLGVTVIPEVNMSDRLSTCCGSTQTGAKWIQRKQACSEVKPLRRSPRARNKRRGTYFTARLEAGIARRLNVARNIFNPVETAGGARL